MQPANLNDLWGQLWVTECLKQGVTYFCISPGSRSTPLTVAAARDKRAKCFTFTDERSAAYFALGIGKATRQPAMLICTSGTALANYFPAVIEASIENIPLFICSADRPPELHQTSANQTIEQANLFGHYTRWFSNIPCPTEAIPPSFLLTTSAQAYASASDPQAGPVHINFSFRKPLEPTPQFISKEYKQTANQLLDTKTPYTTIDTTASDSWTPPERPLPLLSTLQKRVTPKTKGFLIIGRMSSALTEKDKEAIRLFCNKLNWPTYVDLGSGFRYDPAWNTQLQHTSLLLQTSPIHREKQPDCILHLGGAFVSKQLLDYTQQHQETHYIAIQESQHRNDPCHIVNQRIQMKPQDFCRMALPLIEEEEEKQEWLTFWKKKDQELTQTIAEKSLREPTRLLEPILAQRLVEHLPETHVLFVGNSMPIRYLDDWTTSQTPPKAIGLNRGAAGIEGLLSTAMGFATGHHSPAVVYLGDVSAIHDLNALVQLKNNPLPIVIIVPNNSGGGIFRRLPISEHTDVFEDFFVTPHGIELSHIAEAIGICSYKVDTQTAFLQALTEALATKHPVLIEAITNSQDDLEWTQSILQSRSAQR